MSFKKISALFILIPFYFIVNASDSTLFQKRIQKIKSLSTELTEIPKHRFNLPSDTVLIQETYRTTFRKYFKPPFSTPEYNIVYCLASLHPLAIDPGIDSMILRYPDAGKDSIADVKHLTGYLENTIIAYVYMYDDEWELFYFAFEEGTDQLIYLIDAGGELEDYRRKKLFLNKLHSTSDQ